MALRSGHGKGAGSPRVEVLPADEQPYAEPGGAAPLATGRDPKGRVRSTAAARALAKLPRRRDAVPRNLAIDPRFEAHNRRRLEWLRRRRAELSDATGGISHGVGAMLASAAWLYAAGEFAAELAAESADVDLFKQSATLTSTARQHDLAAWELATREGKARQQTTPEAPWLVVAAPAPGERARTADQPANDASTANEAPTRYGAEDGPRDEGDAA